MPSEDKRISRAMRHIVENIDAAKEFTEDLAFEQFLSRRDRIYAVIRALEIISEASRRLPDSLKAKYPEIPWQPIKSAGNVYRHDYEEVSLHIIWNTATEKLTSLRDVMVSELKLQGEDI